MTCSRKEAEMFADKILKSRDSASGTGSFL